MLGQPTAAIDALALIGRFFAMQRLVLDPVPSNALFLRTIRYPRFLPRVLAPRPIPTAVPRYAGWNPLRTYSQPSTCAREHRRGHVIQNAGSCRPRRSKASIAPRCARTARLVKQPP